MSRDQEQAEGFLKRLTGKKAADEVKPRGQVLTGRSGKPVVLPQRTGQQEFRAPNESTGPGPGSRPLRIPKKPTSSVPKKTLKKKAR